MKISCSSTKTKQVFDKSNGVVFIATIIITCFTVETQYVGVAVDKNIIYFFRLEK